MRSRVGRCLIAAALVAAAWSIKPRETVAATLLAGSLIFVGMRRTALIVWILTVGLSVAGLDLEDAPTAVSHGPR